MNGPLKILTVLLLALILGGSSLCGAHVHEHSQEKKSKELPSQEDQHQDCLQCLVQHHSLNQIHFSCTLLAPVQLHRVESQLHLGNWDLVTLARPPRPPQFV